MRGMSKGVDMNEELGSLSSTGDGPERLELRWLGVGAKYLVCCTADGDGGKRSEMPRWCSEESDGI